MWSSGQLGYAVKMVSRQLRATGLALLATLALSTPSAGAGEPPELRFEAPEPLAVQAEALAAVGPEPLTRAMRRLGLDDAGPPIRVELAPEGSPAARRAPSWAVAYAVGGASLVVLIPSRVPGYPDDSIESVLIHEVAHVLIARAAGHRDVPRWLNEGLAIHLAREWRFEDQARVTYATVRRDGVSLDEIERRFQAGRHSAGSAYALSAAFVRFLFDRHGPFVAARLFGHLRGGASFETAFARATGSTLPLEERRFWQHLDLWNRWVPFLTSSATLWMLITALALWAFRRRRARDAEQLAAWEDEDRRRLEQLPTDGWIH